jgi:uncharacterized membrane protein YeaQ/YmgE (transglycosylase-associated protein family)
MNLLMWLETGALVAWLASFRMDTLCRQRLMVDVAVAMIGALLGGLLSAASSEWLSVEIQPLGLAAAAGGSVVLLSLVHLRERRSRQPD